ncbi:hypothetical protein H5410_047237 [Solanum commersonii]|uniref:Uncharacterized protein n=1 Tax=Solanum commersonii TaxID=4109 RepID=A0A9J5XEK3_SOLCO|nr:hypothetical protein H5410_047237 [Solanum commersonii]
MATEGDVNAASTTNVSPDEGKKNRKGKKHQKSHEEMLLDPIPSEALTSHTPWTTKARDDELGEEAIDVTAGEEWVARVEVARQAVEILDRRMNMADGNSRGGHAQLQRKVAPPPFRLAPPPYQFSQFAPPSPTLLKATEEAQHVKKLIQDYIASFIKVGDKVGASKFLKFKDKFDWWVVIKTKPMGRVEVENELDVAYQNKISSVHQVVDAELEMNLEHPNHILEEINREEVDMPTNMEEDEEETFEEDEWIDEEETSEDDACEWIDDEETFE